MFLSLFLFFVSYRLWHVNLQEFPPKSKLDRETYGDQNSTFTKSHIEQSLDGLTVEEVTNYYQMNHISDLRVKSKNIGYFRLWRRKGCSY